MDISKQSLSINFSRVVTIFVYQEFINSTVESCIFLPSINILGKKCIFFSPMLKNYICVSFLSLSNSLSIYLLYVTFVLCYQMYFIMIVLEFYSNEIMFSRFVYRPIGQHDILLGQLRYFEYAIIFIKTSLFLPRMNVRIIPHLVHNIHSIIYYKR